MGLGLVALSCCVIRIGVVGDEGLRHEVPFEEAVEEDIQIGDFKRLGQEEVNTFFDRCMEVLDHRVGRGDYNSCPFELGVVADLFEEFNSMHLRKEEIEKNELGGKAIELF